MLCTVNYFDYSVSIIYSEYYTCINFAEVNLCASRFSKDFHSNRLRGKGWQLGEVVVVVVGASLLHSD